MRNIRELRFRLRIATAILGLLCLIAATLLIFFYTDGNRVAQNFESLHKQVQNRRVAMVPPQTVQDRVKEAREQIAHFYENRFPNSSAAIFEELGRLAKESNVQLETATYKAVVEESPIQGITPIDINAALNGDYAKAMKFINALERNKIFFIVDSVTLGDSEAAGSVRLAVHLETFLRSGA
jgi:type IV pilus assembly protein PilO